MGVDMFDYWLLMVMGALVVLVVTRLVYGPDRGVSREVYHGVPVTIQPVGAEWGWEVFGMIGRERWKWQAQRAVRRAVQAREYAYERRSLPIRVAANAANH